MEYQGLSAAGAACSGEALKWGKEKARWTGCLQRCMLPGNWETHLTWGWEGEEEAAAVYPVLWCALRFWWPQARLTAKESTAGLCIQAGLAHWEGLLLWLMISNSRTCVLETHHWRRIQNGHRNATSYGVTGCIRAKKSHPYPWKNPEIPLLKAHPEDTMLFSPLLMRPHVHLFQPELLPLSFPQLCSKDWIPHDSCEIYR